MIEDALFLALGFFVAVVLAIALLPLLWARALRLTTQRLELLVPWSKGEIDAERDGIRAQAAVEHRRLEQEAERRRAALAVRDAVLGQRTVEIVKLEGHRDALMAERDGLKADLAQQRREVADAEGQRFAAEKALHDADRRIETDVAEARVQAERLVEAMRLAEERRGTIAGLDIRVAGLIAKVEDHEDASRQAKAAASTQQAAFAMLEQQHGTLVTAHAALQRRHADTEAVLDAERLNAAARDLRLQGRTEALAAAEVRMIEQEAAMKRKDEQLAALQKQFDALTAELAARRDSADQDAALRNAIKAAGDDTLRLLGEPAESHHEPAALAQGRS